MKIQRRTGVNGVRENHRNVINQGGTAGFFGLFLREWIPAAFYFTGKTLLL